MQRLADKYHQWESNGVKTLIPNELLQGLLGYAYTCPDMIGGGDYLSFLNESTSLDEELFVRYAQCAALMPMMQFSAAPWRVLSEENARLCVEAALLHIRMSDRIISLARHAAETGEPRCAVYGVPVPRAGAGSRHRPIYAGGGSAGGAGAAEGGAHPHRPASPGPLAIRGRYRVCGRHGHCPRSAGMPALF